MNSRNLFRISAALLAIFGVVWMVAPKAMPASYGLDLDPYAAYYVQQLGTLNIAIAVLFLLVSGMAPSPARRAVVTFFFVQQLLSATVNLVVWLDGVLPASLGLTAFAFNLVFALAFGYFRFIRSEASATPG